MAAAKTAATLPEFKPSKEIAKYLLEIGAVRFSVAQPFKWTSGINSPIYCDNRIINSKVPVRDAVVEAFSSLIRERFLSSIDMICGIATGGVPYGALVADRLKMPFIYVRDKRKEHGLKNIIEGGFSAGQRALLIEDHISTGLSSGKAIRALKEEGLKPVALVSITTYNFKEAEDLFRSEAVETVSICDVDTILAVARERNDLTGPDVDTIKKFIADPRSWS